MFLLFAFYGPQFMIETIQESQKRDKQHCMKSHILDFNGFQEI